jgi:hypothetical protein
MKDFVEYLTKNIVQHPEEVDVKQVDSDNTTIYELSVHDDDMGRVIGKKGQTANAIRTLLTAASAKEGGKRAILEINE